MALSLGTIVLVRDDNLEFHERMVCGQVREADHVVCTPTFEFFVEQLDVADEDIRFYDAAGNPPPGVYPADDCGFNIAPMALREVLVAEGIRIANRLRRGQGMEGLIVLPGVHQTTGPADKVAEGMNSAPDAEPGPGEDGHGGSGAGAGSKGVEAPPGVGAPVHAVVGPGVAVELDERQTGAEILDGSGSGTACGGGLARVDLDEVPPAARPAADKVAAIPMKNKRKRKANGARGPDGDEASGPEEKKMKGKAKEARGPGGEGGDSANGDATQP
jgi:hypothetical protein